MKKQKFLRSLTAVLVVMAFMGSILTGCGGTKAEAPKAEEAKQASAQDTAADKKDEKKTDYKIAWYASAPHPYFEEVKKGVEMFEKEYGITVEKQVGPDWKQPSETENVEALAAKGIKGFSIYPSDPSAANGLYEELTKNGINVVNFGASSVEPTTASYVVATDVKAAAMAATEFVIKKMGEKGNIINILEVLEDANTKLRKEGVEEVVKKYPNVKIIQEVAGMKSVEEAVEKIDTALSANAGKVDGVVATGFTASVGLAQSLGELKKKGNNKPIYSIGIDTDPIVMKAIEEGSMTATIAQNSVGHGYLSCILLKYMQDGWTPKKDSYFINAGYAVVTKDNLTTYTKDIDKVTQEVKASFETKYLEKK